MVTSSTTFWNSSSLSFFPSALQSLDPVVHHAVHLGGLIFIIVRVDPAERSASSTTIFSVRQPPNSFSPSLSVAYLGLKADLLELRVRQLVLYLEEILF